MTTISHADVIQDKILDIIKGSLSPIQSKEIAALLREVHGISMKQYEVRDILWGSLKDKVIYRGKPHWDYSIKEKLVFHYEFANKSILYIDSGDQPLVSLRLSHANSELIYVINKGHKDYNSEHEKTILVFLKAWGKMMFDLQSAEDMFYRYITYLR